VIAESRIPNRLSASSAFAGGLGTVMRVHSTALLARGENHCELGRLEKILDRRIAVTGALTA
jgi:hypothetical protein